MSDSSDVRYVSYGMCAGTTTSHHPVVSLSQAGELEAPLPPPKNTWSECDASSFNLRVGPDYDINKQKASSAAPLYDLVAVDCIRCSSRIDDIASKVFILPEWREVATNHPAVPPVLVVNCQLPSEFPTSFFSEITDGPGASVVCYFRISSSTLSALQHFDTAPPAVKLFARYCFDAVSKSGDELLRGRFKVILRCDNIEEFGLPAFITSYNAKPVLLRQTTSLIRGDGYLEIDVNVHRFGSVPKRALQLLLDKFSSMLIKIGFCIESRTNEEMPETLFGCAALNFPTFSKYAEWMEGRE